MSVVPAIRKCDVCTLPIPTGRQFCEVPVLIPAALRKKILEHLKANPPTGPFGMKMSPEQITDSNVAETWECHVCYACLFGLLPQLLEAIEKAVPEWVAQKQAAQEEAERSRREYAGETS